MVVVEIVLKHGSEILADPARGWLVAICWPRHPDDTRVEYVEHTVEKVSAVKLA